MSVSKFTKEETKQLDKFESMFSEYNTEIGIDSDGTISTTIQSPSIRDLASIDSLLKNGYVESRPHEFDGVMDIFYFKRGICVKDQKLGLFRTLVLKYFTHVHYLMRAIIKIFKVS